VSVSVASALFTCASEPVIVRLFEFAPETPAPLAESRPAPSETVAVKVSPDVSPVSESEIP